MNKLTLLILNTTSLIYALVMNGLSGAGVFAGKTVGEISNIYETLFAPSGYAFSIWGLIYLLLIAFVAHQWYDWYKNENGEVIKQTGLWFALSSFANGTWIYFWLNESIGVSMVLMLVLLVSLVVLTVKLRLEIWDAPLRIVAFVWWPICIYLGWIIVATVANFAAFFVSIDWNGGPFSPKTWTIIMMITAAVIYLLLIYFRNLREAALVGVWALTAIAVKHWGTESGIVTAAIISAAVLLLIVAIHAYKNKPINHLKQ